MGRGGRQTTSHALRRWHADRAHREALPEETRQHPLPSQEVRTDRGVIRLIYKMPTLVAGSAFLLSDAREGSPEFIELSRSMMEDDLRIGIFAGISEREV